MSKKQIIFVSCGQQTAKEKNLGNAIKDLIESTTDFEAYFADSVSSLEGLTKNIFDALKKCAGFIVVLHPRGSVTPRNDARASVWVEQEIAIAAYQQFISKRQIQIAAYIRPGIMIEGIRRYLQVIPKSFTNNSEVLDDLQQILPQWKPTRTSDIELTMNYKEIKITEDRHDYRISVLLKNTGTQKLVNYHVDLEFPAVLIERPENLGALVANRCTSTHKFLRTTQDDHRVAGPLLPGDTRTVLTLGYFMDREIFSGRPEVLDEIATVTLYTDEVEPIVVNKRISELQCF
jgi:hypothetical protein